MGNQSKPIENITTRPMGLMGFLPRGSNNFFNLLLRPTFMAKMLLQVSLVLIRCKYSELNKIPWESSIKIPSPMPFRFYETLLAENLV